MLSLASILAKYAHDNARSLQEAAVFSTIGTIVSGAITAQGLISTMQNAQIAQNELQQLLGQSQQKAKRAA